MRLKILLPTKVLVDEEVHKVTAEAPNGAFCLLPKHVDFVAALSPGLLSYEKGEEKEVFVAVDEGVIVKAGWDVRISTRNAVMGMEIRLFR